MCIEWFDPRTVIHAVDTQLTDFQIQTLVGMGKDGASLVGQVATALAIPSGPLAVTGKLAADQASKVGMSISNKLRIGERLQRMIPDSPVVRALNKLEIDYDQLVKLKDQVRIAIGQWKVLNDSSRQVFVKELDSIPFGLADSIEDAVKKHNPRKKLLRSYRIR